MKNRLLYAAAVMLLCLLIPVCAFAADTATGSFDVMLVGGAQVVQDNGEPIGLWTPNGSAKGHRFSYEITYAFNVPNGVSIPAGTLRFVIPKSVISTRDGSVGDAYEMSLPHLQAATDAAQGISPELYLAYEEQGDNLVITNFRDLAAMDYAGYFQIAYYTTQYTYEYADYHASGFSGKRYEVNLSFVDSLGTQVNTTKSTVPVAMNTTAGVTSTEKNYPTLYKQWQTGWGTKPSDADHYWYLTWSISTTMKSPTTQPYHLTIQDVPGEVRDSSGRKLGDLEICGYFLAGSNTLIYPDASGAVYAQDQTLGYTRADMVLTRVRADDVKYDEIWSASNSISVTVDPKDQLDPDKTVHASREYTYHTPDYTPPLGRHNAWKRADGTFRKHGSYAWDTEGYTIFNGSTLNVGAYSRYDLNEFVEGKLDYFDGFDYAVWIWNDAYSLTADPEKQNEYKDKKRLTTQEIEEIYGQRPIGYEMVDQGEDGGVGVKLVVVENGVQQEDGLVLTADDFEFTSLQYRIAATAAVFDEDSQTFKKRSAVLSSSDVIAFYARYGESSDYVKIAEVSLGSAPVAAITPEGEAAGVSVDTQSGTVMLPAGTTAYKFYTENTYYSTSVGVVANLRLKASARVLNYIQGAEQIGISNTSRGILYSCDPQSADNKPKVAKVTPWKEDYDYARISQRNSLMTKSVVSGRNDTLKRQFVVSWYITLSEMIRSGQDDSEESVLQQGGVFYDLLPLGCVLNEDSVAVMADGKYLEASDFEIEQRANFRDHRTLVVVRVFEPAGDYALSFDTLHAWDIIRDLGTAIDNIAAYQTGNRDIARGYPDNGGALSQDRRPLISGLDPSSSGQNRFLYAEDYYDIVNISSASTGLSKRVKALEDEQFSDDTTVIAGRDYIYRIRFAADPGVEYTNMIFFDELESDTKAGASSEWYGTLTDVDINHLLIMGIDAKVYYATQSGVLPSQANDSYVFDPSVWTLVGEQGIPENAKAVAIDMRHRKDGRPFVLSDSAAVFISMFMRAPEKLPDTVADKNSYPETYNGVSFLGTRTATQTGDYVHELREIGATTVRYIVASDIPVTKKSAQDENVSIGGITFRLFGTSDYGTMIDCFEVTDKRGRAVFEDIEKGTYTLYEYASTPDWLLDETQHTVVIDKQGNYTIDGQAFDSGNLFVKRDLPRIHGDLLFYKKVRAAGNYAEKGVEGISFRLSGISDYGNDIEAYATSDAGGEVRFDNLEKGVGYVLEEVTTGWDSESMYLPMDVKLSVTVNEYGEAVIDCDSSQGYAEQDEAGGAYTVWNDRRYLDFCFYKRDASTGVLLEGAEFTLSGNADSGASYKLDAVSDGEGKVSFEGLERGTYVLRETKAPSRNGVNYQLDPTEYYVTLSANGTVSIAGMTFDDTIKGYIMDNEPANDNELIIYKKWVDSTPENRIPPELTVWTGEDVPLGLGYAVTYVANGGAFDGVYEKNLVRYYTDENGTARTAGTYKDPQYVVHLDGTGVPDSMVFEGWFDENGVRFDETTAASITENKTVYAHWSLSKIYTCKNEVQSFTVPVTGWYKLEVWGAQGGYDSARGGKGGYSSGCIQLGQGTRLFVMVGGAGWNIAHKAGGAGWNGGGYSGSVGSSGGGGGMTHISLIANPAIHGEQFNADAEKTLIVAGGGGGGGLNPKGSYGHGGGLTAVNGANTRAQGGNTLDPDQNGGLRGNGEDRDTGSTTLRDGGGGGGGWYSGRHAGVDSTAGGGSGYLNPLLVNAQSIPGDMEMPTVDGLGTQIGNGTNTSTSASGAAKITYISGFVPEPDGN